MVIDFDECEIAGNSLGANAENLSVAFALSPAVWQQTVSTNLGYMFKQSGDRASILIQYSDKFSLGRISGMELKLNELGADEIMTGTGDRASDTSESILTVSD